MSVPKGWSHQELSALAEFKSGGTPSKARVDYWGGSTPWITVKDLKTLHPTEFHQSLTEDGAATARVMPAGTVYVVVRGMALFKDLPVAIVDRAAAFNQDIKALTATDGVDPEFLAYALVAHKSGILQLVDQAGHGTGRLDTTLLQAFSLPVPPLPEQRKIAEILRTWDEAEAGIRRLVTAATEKRSWLRQEVLSGQTRLSGFTEPWIRAPLASVLTEHGNKSTGSEEVHSVSVHKGVINQMEHLGRSFAAKNTGQYNRVSPGDIVYTKSPTGDFPLGVIKQSTVETDAIVSPLYGVFKPVSRALGNMLNAYFESPIVTQNYLHPLVQKGAKNTLAITNQRFLEGYAALPVDLAEQDAIAAIMDMSALEIQTLRMEETLLKEQKRGLMQQLLTGKIRVKVNEGEVTSV